MISGRIGIIFCWIFFSGYSIIMIQAQARTVTVRLNTEISCKGLSTTIKATSGACNTDPVNKQGSVKFTVDKNAPIGSKSVSISTYKDSSCGEIDFVQVVTGRICSNLNNLFTYNGIVYSSVLLNVN